MDRNSLERSTGTELSEGSFGQAEGEGTSATHPVAEKTISSKPAKNLPYEGVIPKVYLG
jgi:hypothetical protein